jgi:hypothetical protein
VRRPNAAGLSWSSSESWCHHLPLVIPRAAQYASTLGFGRIVALYYRSPTSYQIH